jgi:hypothetical protein
MSKSQDIFSPIFTSLDEIKASRQQSFKTASVQGS